MSRYLLILATAALLSSTFASATPISVEEVIIANGGIVIETPTFGGKHFLALTAPEQMAGETVQQIERANHLCSFLGYGAPVIVTVDAITSNSEYLFRSENGIMVPHLEAYQCPNGRSYDDCPRTGRVSPTYFTRIACRQRGL